MFQNTRILGRVNKDYRSSQNLKKLVLFELKIFITTRSTLLNKTNETS